MFRSLLTVSILFALSIRVAVAQSGSYAAASSQSSASAYAASSGPYSNGGNGGGGGCLEVWKPVCCYNGDCFYTFANQCYMDRYNEGRAPGSRAFYALFNARCEDYSFLDVCKGGNCEVMCTNDRTMVCASNGQCVKQFWNACYQYIYNCRNPMDRFTETVDCNAQGNKMCPIIGVQ